MAIEGRRLSGYRMWHTYEKIKEGNKPLPNSFHWDLIIKRRPTWMYFPPEEIFHIRLISFTPPKYTPPSVEEKEIHGYKLKQYGLADYSGTSEGTSQDRLDYSIWTAFRELLYEADRPLDRTARPKQDFFWDCDVIQLDDMDYPVRKWVILDALLSDISDNITMDGTKSIIGEITFTFSYQLAYEVHLRTGDML